MKYSEFRDHFQKFPLFSSRSFGHLTPKPGILLRQVNDWVAKGWVIQLRRQLYTLREIDRSIGLSSYFLANELYQPSYISLETALSYYGLIPEQVFAIISVTTKKTQIFENSFGKFYYHHIQPKRFNDFIEIQDEYKQSYWIATPERALIDYLYFHWIDPAKVDKDFLEESLRLQNRELIDVSKLKIMSERFNSKRVQHLIERLFIPGE